MSVAVVIGAAKASSPWLPGLLEGTAGMDWPLVVHVTDRWELATIGWAARHFDEFVFLPESTTIEDTAVFDLAFHEIGMAVSLAHSTKVGFPAFWMYLGKYVGREVLEMGVPTVADKHDAVRYENDWCREYARRYRVVRLGGEMDHSDLFVERFGRRNMVVSNEYLTRYKGAWDAESLAASAGRRS